VVLSVRRGARSSASAPTGSTCSVRHLVLPARGADGLAPRENARARRRITRRRLGLDVELAVQDALLRYPRLVHGLNVGYGLFKRDAHGRLARAALPASRRAVSPLPPHCLLAHVGAQPSLPPPSRPRHRASRRLRRHALRRSAGSTSRIRSCLRFYNPVAAMPSLHVAVRGRDGAEIAGRQRFRGREARGPLVTHRSSRPSSREPATTTCSDAVAGAALGRARSCRLTDELRPPRSPAHGRRVPALGRRSRRLRLSRLAPTTRARALVLLRATGDRLGLLRADPSLR
jgi:hypothetical protein